MKHYKHFNPIPETLEELKATYRHLAMKYHPDRGGETVLMQELNNEYDEIFPKVKDLHVNREGETYTKETTEAPEMFRNIVETLIRMRMDGVLIEVIGSFLWLSGNTMPYKNGIKALGFKWSKNKRAWYMAPPGYVKRSRKDYTITDIRQMFGSAVVSGSQEDSVSPKHLPA